MEKCKLISELRKLKRSSNESVDNASVEDSSHSYFHVVRKIEEEMRELLHKVNRRGKKALILLCGSAGDGKSHLLSYLKYSDVKKEQLLDGYEICNDATESSAPRMTAVETLAEKLVDFDDDHLSNNDGKKMVLAINLGTLNNFISSKADKKYEKLATYVKNQGIISDFESKENHPDESLFYHISFADYHMFSLSEDGAGYEDVDTLIKKIINDDKNNPYYMAYRTCDKCHRHTLCPIRQNFEFMWEKINRDAIEYCLLEVEFKDKLILSTRDVLDFIYRIIVPPNYTDVFETLDSIDQTGIAENYIQSTTPMLLFDSEGVSELLSIIKNYDPLRIRSKDMDMDAIHIHSLDDIESEYKKVTKGTPYAKFVENSNLQKEASNPNVRQKIFNFLARLKMIRSDDFKKGNNNHFEQYLQYIYYQNTDQEKELTALYKMVIKAAMRWNGIVKDEYICIDNSNREICVLEQLSLEGVHTKQNENPPKSIIRYAPYIMIQLKNSNQSDDQKNAKLNMDYSLFKLIVFMNDDYMPTAHDRNIHKNFDSYVQQLIKLGNKDKKVIIYDKVKNCYMSFSVDRFEQYDFKVVD
jgi:DNA phosphorothioation-dependent restriction protein DptF